MWLTKSTMLEWQNRSSTHSSRILWPLQTWHPPNHNTNWSFNPQLWHRLDHIKLKVTIGRLWFVLWIFGIPHHFFVQRLVFSLGSQQFSRFRNYYSTGNIWIKSYIPTCCKVGPYYLAINGYVTQFFGLKHWVFGVKSPYFLGLFHPISDWWRGPSCFD